MRETILKKLIYLYLVIPVLVFIIGWIKPLLAIPVVIGVIVAAGNVWKRIEDTETKIPWKTVLIAFIIALVWCVLAGQGGYYYQSVDHNARNAIFRDLITREWPVIYPEKNMGMIYYTGHWLIPALFGKIAYVLFGEIVAWEIGNFLLLLWSSIGITMVFLLLFKVLEVKTTKKIILAALLMIFFSGLDIVGIAMQCVTNRRLILIDHIECWATVAEYSSLTTCLFWVYNQTVVPWIIILLYLNGESKRNYAFLGIICILYGPLPAIGLLPFMLGSAVCDFVKAKGKQQKIDWMKEVFSIPNILATLLLFPLLLVYFWGNNAWTESALGYMDNSPWGSLKTILVLIAFIVLEFGAYAVLIFKQYRKERNYYIMVASLLLILLFQVGRGSDFVMRVSMPALIVLMAMVVKELLNFTDRWKQKGINRICALLLTGAFALGTVTPLVEYGRSVYQVVKAGKIDLVSDEIKTLERQLAVWNFVTFDLENNYFFNNIAK